MFKVLWSFKYEEILGIKGFDPSKLNKNINTEKGGIEFLSKARDWSKKEGQNRLAFLSSYGFSNVNSAILLEEPENFSNNISNPKEPILICLSAATKEQLKQQQIQLLSFIEQVDKEKLSLKNLAYTLQVGREPLRHRFAAKVESLSELELILSVAPQLTYSTKTIFIGDQKKPTISVEELLKDKETLDQLLVSHFEKGNWGGLAELWVNGINIKWEYCYQNEEIARMRLPTYPFAKERYWFPKAKTLKTVVSNGKLHPLLHSNESDLTGLKFQSTFTGEEFFLIDHQLNKQKIFPGVAYLELARVAGELSIHQPVHQLKDVVWTSPFFISKSPKQMQISLVADGQDIGFKLFSKTGDKSLIHSQGKLSLTKISPSKTFDIAAIKNRLPNEKQGKAVYELYSKLGLDYGKSFQGLQVLYHNKTEALSKISLPKKVDYTLQPNILDSALQTCIGLNWEARTKRGLLPASVKEVTIFQIPEKVCWCYFRKSEKDKADSPLSIYDVDLLSETGEVLVQFKEYAALPLEGVKVTAPTNNTNNHQSPTQNGHALLQKEKHGFNLKSESIAQNALVINISQKEIKEFLLQKVADLLTIESDEIAPDEALKEYGIDSIMLTQLAAAINDHYEIDLLPTEFYNYPTIEGFAIFLEKELSTISPNEIKAPVQNGSTVSTFDAAKWSVPPDSKNEKPILTKGLGLQNPNKKILLNDVSVRDGSHAVKHQLTLDDFKTYTEAIDSVGLDMVEIGAHGNGLGASSIQMGEAFCDDKEALKVARMGLKNTKLSVHVICGFGTLKRDVIPAMEIGVDVFRMASLCTEAAVTERHIKFLKKENKEVFGVLMMTHLIDEVKLLEQAKKMEDYGAEALILMDSAGAYLPDDVTRKVGLMVDRLNIPVGFHAHNNFNLGVSHALTALNVGATIIDAASAGFGAGSGNTRLEVLVAILQKMGFRQDIDLFALLDAVQLAKDKFITQLPHISEISILTAMNGLFSGFSKPVLKAASQFDVSYRDIFQKLGDLKALGGQEDLIIEVAQELQREQLKRQVNKGNLVHI